METKNSIISNMNPNGGGLAFNITGKYESNRHALARCEKFTFGEVVKELAKKKNGGIKISAIELLEIYTLIFGEPEWHHAGFIPKKYGGGMKKTYFLDEIPTSEMVIEWKCNAEIERKKRKDKLEIEKRLTEIKSKFLKKYAEKFTRTSTIPKFGFSELEEMNGKFGWFEAQPNKYNLPIYYSGWVFRSKRSLEKYFSL